MPATVRNLRWNVISRVLSGEGRHSGSAAPEAFDCIVGARSEPLLAILQRDIASGRERYNYLQLTAPLNAGAVNLASWPTNLPHPRSSSSTTTFGCAISCLGT